MRLSTTHQVLTKRIIDKKGSLKTAVSLPTGNIHIGEKYEATYVLKDLNLICKEGFNRAY
jgi:hypothetical protein